MKKKIKFYLTSKNRKIRYSLINQEKGLVLIFFHGFMSDMDGEKPLNFEYFAKKLKIGFLRFEYSGHGKSSGKFINGSITEWSNDAKDLIKNKISKNKKIIFIGSSMGSWIALNLAKYFKKQLVGFVGISSAPEFTEKIMWRHFTQKMRNQILKNNIIELENDYKSTYPITKKLIFDGRKNKVFSKLKLKIPVILFHGTNDKTVPIIFSKRTLKLFNNKKKKLFIIKNGDHSLSKKINLKKINTEIKKLIKQIF